MLAFHKKPVIIHEFDDSTGSAGLSDRTFRPLLIPAGRPPVTSERDPTITGFLNDFRGGDSQAFGELWNHYFARLVEEARGRLRNGPRLKGSDEEDVVLSALNSFHRRARRGDFPRLEDRDDLWVQLVTLTNQKIVDHRRRERAQKRGGDRTVTEAELATRPEDEGRGLAAIVGREPDPAFIALVTEQCRRLLDLLGDATLREVALLKMGMFTHQEIADKYGRSLSWVNRKLDLIRTLWEVSAGHGSIAGGPN
jgi:DNA-directed RNA polymerase specialized sigma24 family protein